MIETCVTRMPGSKVNVAEAHRARELARLLAGVERRVASRPDPVAPGGPIAQALGDPAVGAQVDVPAPEAAQEPPVALTGLHAVEPVPEPLGEEAEQALLVAMAHDRALDEHESAAGLDDPVREVGVLACRMAETLV